MIRTLVLLFIMLFCATPLAAHAKARDDSIFSALPVLHEGRIKPLDSMARIELQKIHGTDRVNGMNATTWLARVLFTPQAAAQDKVFIIRDPQLRHQLGLPPGPQHKFSLYDLSAGLDKTKALVAGLMQSQEKLTPPQKSLLDLHESAMSMTQLMGAITMVLPLDPDSTTTWMDMRKDESALQQKIKAIVRTRGNAIEKYSETEKLFALSAMQMDMLSQAGARNILFRIIPPRWAGSNDEWQSPWQTLLGGGGSPETAGMMKAWRNMAAAYIHHDAAAWADSTQAASTLVHADASLTRLRVEVMYRAINPLRIAELVYILSLVLLVASFWRTVPWLYPAALAAGILGVVLHAGAITTRMIILDRPPVGTLYESLLFVSLVLFTSALAIDLRRRDRVALCAGLGGTLALLFAAPVFSPLGDSMEMLVAVLNTGFWLATHVICITIGYGVSLLAGIIAHFSLLRQDSKLDTLLHRVLVAALFFTAFGTMLGGIWADQSWGRFWGWDPKENGALLIVVWIAWVLHGRYGGQLRGVTFHMAAAFLNVIVALAWFGVNLLNVGLHSYGFTGEMAAGLGLFCILETALIAAAYVRGKT